MDHQEAMEKARELHERITKTGNDTERIEKIATALKEVAESKDAEVGRLRGAAKEAVRVLHIAKNQPSAVAYGMMAEAVDAIDAALAGKDGG